MFSLTPKIGPEIVSMGTTMLSPITAPVARTTGYTSPQRGNIAGIPGGTAGGAGAYDQVKMLLINVYGLRPQLADEIIKELIRRGEVPTREVIERYVAIYSGGSGTSGTGTTVTEIPEIDELVSNVTGENTYEMDTGFTGAVVPETMWQKNKNWIVPAAIGTFVVVVGRVIYIRNKNK